MKKLILVSVTSLLFATCIIGCKNQTQKAQALYVSALDAYTIFNLDEAYAFAKTSLDADKNLFQSEFLIGKTQFFKNDYENAEKTFSKLIKKHPEYLEAEIWLIRTLILNQKYNEAESLLRKQLEYNNTDWRIFYLYSLLYDKQGILDQKLLMLTNAEMAIQDSAKVFTAQASTWGLLGLDEREAECLLKAQIIGNFQEFLDEK